MLKKHRDNLTKLATYLESLPDDYDHFGMDEYNADEFGKVIRIENRRYDCGTVACAVGHGPAAGIRLHKDNNWRVYAKRAFGVSASVWEDDPVWDYLFSHEWARYDDTHQGAAARIRTFLAGGVPDGWEEAREA